MPGLLSLVVLLGCGIFLLAYQPAVTYRVAADARRNYRFFEELNKLFAWLLGNSLSGEAIYQSPVGVAIMRFIAFAYSYHYLNWFSKTSIIKWHEASWQRLGTIAALWMTAVGLYYYRYDIGFIALYTLSFLHVYLEFPLNHQTFMGIGRELKTARLQAFAPVKA